tara:strand:- start:134 stop:397 length:264 start_codon:yes stop_codon:yes gene_type:complete
VLTVEHQDQLVQEELELKIILILITTIGQVVEEVEHTRAPLMVELVELVEEVVVAHKVLLVVLVEQVQLMPVELVEQPLRLQVEPEG